MIELPSCPVDARWAALERKRRLLWHNATRNEFVARLAAALVEGDGPGLRSCGVRLSAQKRRQAREGWEVAILVESIRHGAALLKLLPSWELLDARASDDDGQSNGSRESNDGKRPAGKIVTLLRAWKDGIDTNVLIRATGGSGRLVFDSETAQGVEIRAQVDLTIDFVDNADEQTVKDTESRIDSYRVQGLDVTDASRTT